MRWAYFLALLAIGIQPLCAQEEDPFDRKGKFFLIPELWMSFGSRSYVELAPMLGYHVNHRFSLGMGPHYIYQSQRSTPYLPYAYHTHSYGMKAFLRYALITRAEDFLPIKLFSELFAHAEYEGLSFERAFYMAPNLEKERRLYQGLLLGGGLSQNLGPYNSIYFMVLWDLNESIYSPYTNPVFRIGFNAFL